MLHAGVIHPDDELLTLPQAARALGVSPMTMRVWMLEGRLPVRMAGRLALFRRADVEAYHAARVAEGRT
jgi:excisionase family DNA binding protein